MKAGPEPFRKGFARTSAVASAKVLTRLPKGLSCPGSLLRQGMPSCSPTLAAMTIASGPKLEPQHPPLARDTAGNLIAVPDGMDSLALSRETFGRPRKLRGPDKHLMRFPLHTSPEDVVELCGPGIYRVYALDAVGEQLGDDHVARWDLTPSSREHRNTSMDPMVALRADRHAMPATPATDLRFALEAMAQMMRTNTDALRLVAESQVDLAKAIATVKGLPRNAAMYLPPAPANDDSDEYEEEEEDDEVQEARPSSYLDLLLPFSQALAPKVAEMFPGLVVGMNAPSPVNAEAVEVSAESSDLASRPFEARELVDLQYARKKGQAKRAVSRQPAPLKTRVMEDPKLMQQIMAIKKELAPDEIETLMSAVGTWAEAAQTKFLDEIKPVSTELAVAYCREVIESIRARQTAAES